MYSSPHTRSGTTETAQDTRLPVFSFDLLLHPAYERSQAVLGGGSDCGINSVAVDAVVVADRTGNISQQTGSVNGTAVFACPSFQLPTLPLPPHHSSRNEELLDDLTDIEDLDHLQYRRPQDHKPRPLLDRSHPPLLSEEEDVPFHTSEQAKPSPSSRSRVSFDPEHEHNPPKARHKRRGPRKPRAARSGAYEAPIIPEIPPSKKIKFTHLRSPEQIVHHQERKNAASSNRLRAAPFHHQIRRLIEKHRPREVTLARKFSVIRLTLDARNFPSNSTALGAVSVEPGVPSKQSAKYYVKNHSFRHITQVDRTILFVDDPGRIVAVYTPPLKSQYWNEVTEGVAEALLFGLRFAGEADLSVKECRGSFSVVNAGVYHGQGTHGPVELNQTSKTPESVRILVEWLKGHWAVREFARRQCEIFAYYFPKLYAYYGYHFDNVLEHLGHIFAHSVFPTVAFNLGPQTVCEIHQDLMNWWCGICAITAAGNFDHTKGGQMILPQFSLVVDFPAGSSFHITSASVGHGNTPLASPSETRQSITQFGSADLLSYDIFHGLQTHMKRRDPAEYNRLHGTDGSASRFELGLRQFSTLSSLHEDQDYVFPSSKLGK